MSLESTVEVWDALRIHIDSHERKDAADTLVTLLIENNFEVVDIKEAFRGDKEILSALKGYVDDHDDDEDFIEDEDYNEDED